MYSTLCRVEADTSRLSIPPKISKHQRMQYYEIKFEILLSLGLTELKAHICWQENVSFLLVYVPRYLYRAHPYILSRAGYRKKASIYLLFSVVIGLTQYLGVRHRWCMTLRSLFENEG